MTIEYVDVFLKEERFVFVCSKCFSMVIPGYHEHHTAWHEKEEEGKQ